MNCSFSFFFSFNRSIVIAFQSYVRMKNEGKNTFRQNFKLTCATFSSPCFFSGFTLSINRKCLVYLEWNIGIRTLLKTTDKKPSYDSVLN